jgi:hypothetical protein
LSVLNQESPTSLMRLVEGVSMCCRPGWGVGAGWGRGGRWGWRWLIEVGAAREGGLALRLD